MADKQSRHATRSLRYPTVADLERLARRRIPYFTFDFLKGGTGEELSCARNYRAMQEIEIVPRYGHALAEPSTSTTLFGRTYASPIVIAPVGMDGAMWPGAPRFLAETARESNIAYMPSTMSTMPIEDVARIAPQNTWFQLYGFPADDHAVTFDLIRRADEAGAQALAVTLDIPAPARRVRDMRNGMLPRMRLTPEKILAMLTRPAWLAALSREGAPALVNLRPYCAPGAGRKELEAFMRTRRAGGGITWELMKRIREKWKKPLLVKGVMHPGDAVNAREIGVDGVVVSNHGGRQFDPSPASIDVLPAIRAAVGPEMTVLMDSGIMSGVDVLKALVCGADGVLVGRAFMFGLGALGGEGARHVATLLNEELRVALVQSGACTIDGARQLSVRHRGAWAPEDFRG